MAEPKGDSERLRVPQPLIKRRVPSGRGAMEQPNVTHDGEAALTLRFWIALIVTSSVTGLIGIFLMWVLKIFETLAFHYHSGDYSAAVAATSSLRRVEMLTLAGMVGGVGWYLIRRFFQKEKAEIDDAIWNGDGELGIRRSFLTGTLSEIVIGLGASIGREAAPKLLGGASGSWLAHRFNLTSEQKRLLVACAGGAGFACVYNVPLGGAIFTAEVLYGSFALPVAMAALTSSTIATMVGWLYLQHGPTYADIPNYRFSTSLEVWSVIAGVIIGLLALSYIRVVGLVSHYRIKGAHIIWAMPIIFAGVGLLGTKYPQLFGNGKDIAHTAFLGSMSIGLLFALLALKPLATVATLGSSASGGVFTPFFATGALAGGFLGAVWLHWWPGTPVGAFAVVGAAAMLGASMQAPLAGMVLVMELMHGGFSLMVPMLTATAIGTILVRQVDGYSIYSARLPRH
jgi:chloride channel protein, CIC family